MLSQTSTMSYHPKHRSWWPKHECVICGSKAIGFNFGAPTCAPCKGNVVLSKFDRHFFVFL
jgi:hypothetical protein